MLTGFHAMPTFDRTHWPVVLVRSSDRSSRPIARSLRSIWPELLEGMMEVVRRGIPTDMALGLALGVAHAGKCVCTQLSETECQRNARAELDDRLPCDIGVTRSEDKQASGQAILVGGKAGADQTEPVFSRGGSHA